MDFKIRDMTGEVFGKLRVLRISPKRTNRQAWWFCECECGNTVERHGASLRSGKSQSCGCFKKKHGMFDTSEHAAWTNMIQRCHNDKHPQYERYGLRGIVVCDEWRESFSKFIADVGKKPEPHLTLERVDNDKGYEPGNVRWATRHDQYRNRSNNKYVHCFGQEMTIGDAIKRHAVVNPKLVRKRMKEGMPVEQALTTPTR